MPGFWLQCLCSKFWIYWVGVSTKFTTWQIQNLQHDNRLCCSFFFLINHSSFLPALRETEDLEQVAQYGSKCINTNCGHKNIYESTSDNRRQIRHYRIGTRFKCLSMWFDSCCGIFLGAFFSYAWLPFKLIQGYQLLP